MSFQLQQTVRNNAQQLREYVTDLYDWEAQMQLKQKIKQKEKKINQRTKETQQQQFRKKKIQQQARLAEQARVQKLQKKKQMVRDVNTVQDYYNAWDKFNPDEELKRLQQEEKREYRPYNPYEDSKNHQRAKPKAQMIIKGSRNVIVKDPTSLKDKGNVHFKVCDYERAIQCYTQCINKVLNEEDPATENNRKLLALVYSNRAMAYIKINQRAKALLDCNQSLKNDEKYVKTYLRRADCLRKLGKYKQSLSDYRKLKYLSPDDRQVDVEIKKIEEFLKKRIRETQQSMIVSSIPAALPGGHRIHIEEKEQFDNQDIGESLQITEPTNYLQQL